MQHTDKAIAEFEAWWGRQPHREQFEDLKDQMRNVWLASRRELVIDMPARDLSVNGGLDSEMGPSAEQYQGAGYNLALDDCRAAIEAAGVTVRG